MPATTEIGCDPGLLAALADPSTYGATKPVEVHETHASWVFLSGDRAFKLKKPLNLGFLDYSTLARRHSACLEEVRVNRELAPGIYRGVRAIVRSKEGVAMTSEGTTKAVDYVVEMRRFRDADTLAGLIASAGLSAVHIQAVARRLAAFHRDAAVVAGGGAQELLRRWRVNVRELREAGRATGSSADLSAGFAEAFVSVHSEELERRRRAGLVRDGHGDLRCEHVLAVPTVRVVDRIEFDPSLRHADIACDLAFLTMDLEAHGQRWAAEELVGAYRREGMDAGSETLLAFYAAHHALVRAKVALIAAAEHDRRRSAELLEQAGSMLALAERLCWRARGPLAVLICGPAASGKSTLAAELSRRAGLAVLSSDATRKAAAGLSATERATREHYSHRFTHLTYELLAAQARELLDAGKGVIVDASCRSRSQRSTLLGPLRRSGLPPLVVRCDVPLEVALERAARRMHDPDRVSDADPRIVTEQHRSFQPLEELPPGSVIELDATLPLNTQVEGLTRAIDRRLAADVASAR
ncbi:MAG TPA: AAA family ATPase [Solirubrobacteraceae bacterium]|nr:AAA family ATPase [Solirubrobacteraceae bacterium]